MKNKKGFTLIELLGVVIILGILLAIAVPSITKYLKRGTVEYYHSLENEIKASGMDYLETYRTLLPRQVGNVAVIDIKELVYNKYIDEIKDEEGNICTGQVTAKKIDSGSYEYYSCLKCGDLYTTGGDSCNYSEFDNIYVDSELYRIELEKDKYEVEQGKKFDLPLAKVYYNDKLIDDKLEGSPNKIDTNILGSTKVIYYYHGVKKEIEVVVVDKTKPSKPEVVLKKDGENGKSYLSSTWYSGNIYQLFKSTDYTKVGVLGSGIKEYQISTDGKIFTTLTSNNKIDTQDGVHKYYVRSVDKNGNISDVNSYTIKIDQERPKCSLEVKSGTLGKNDWYISNVTIGFKNITETVSSIVSSPITPSSITTDTTGSNVVATIMDEAGNINICSITVKLDKTNPSVETSVNQRTATFRISDNFGVVAYGISNSTGTEPIYTAITSTMNTQITWKAAGPGDYVVWVKDEAGRTSNKSFTISPSAFVWEYTSPGEHQFIAPSSGVYKFNLFGAAGGNDVGAGGYGGNAIGYKYLDEGDYVYIYVGGAGTNGFAGAGGSNGGGHGGDAHPVYGGGGAGGGGATHVATSSGTLYSLRNNRTAVLLVAGGGGGGSRYGGGLAGGAGGGYRGGGNCNGGLPAMSNKASFWLDAATTSRPGLADSIYEVSPGWYGYLPPTEHYSKYFGQGISANVLHKDSGNTWGADLSTSGGGGGGYYGGGTTLYSGGGGGSAYLDGMPTFTYNGVSYSPTTTTALKSGDGKAIVTLEAIGS